MTRQLEATPLQVRRRPILRWPAVLKQTPMLLLCLAAVSTLTLTIGHRFYNEPKLDVGTIAPTTILAPEAAEVVDTLATQSEQDRVRQTIKVFTLDRQVNQKIQAQLQLLLQEAQQVRKLAGPFPVVPVGDLPIELQSHLRQVDRTTWQSIVRAATTTPSSPESLNNLDQTSQSAVQALQRYRQRRDLAALRRWVKNFDASRLSYNSVTHYQTLEFLNGTNIPVAVLDLSELEWQQVNRELPKILDRMLAQGILPGLETSILEKAVELQVAASLPQSAVKPSVQLLMADLRANIIADPIATQQQAETAANQVDPVLLSVKQGEVIVQRGFTINQQAFAKLEHFNLTQRKVNAVGLACLGLWIACSIQVVIWVQQWRDRKLRHRDYWLLLLLTGSVPLCAALGISFTPLPLMGLLISSFHGGWLGSVTVGLLTGSMMASGTLPLKSLLSSAAGGLLASAFANRLRSREELALLGGGVGLTQGAVYLLLHLLTYGGSSWVNVIGIAAMHGLTGFAWCVVALGLSPYLEHFFDLITPIRLAELSNPNRSLLQRLATETPGTFQHTLFVSTLAEAAARELGGNVELVRAGCLYHDIGKMHDPLAFIENQLGCENKHDQIDDPWISADLIKKHVTEGLAMARRHRLPKAIQMFIPEHQGTMLIAYFYHQAQVRAEADPSIEVHESDFRYAGPVPQSRETALVMLADSCEAALRSLKTTEPKIALSTVYKIFKARWQDQQMDASGLKKEEMPKIAEIFVRVWQEHHHQRIAYPKAMLKPRLATTPNLASDES